MTPTAIAGRQGHAAVILLPLVLALLLTTLAAPALAQTCQVSNTPTLDFGTTSPTANTDAQTTVTLSCQGPPTFSAQITACIFIDLGSPGGMAPRRMSNGAGALMNYDLYSNPARTQLLGPFGGGYPIYAINFPIATAAQIQVNFTIYGRIPRAQALPAAYVYTALPGASVVRYSYGSQLLPSPSAENCRDGTSPLFGGAGLSNFTFGTVQARAANTCVLDMASDLDFGSASSLDSPLDQISEIRMRCATDTPWSITLDQGINPDNGQRRMASNGSYINYELYQDPRLNIPWGNTRETGTSEAGVNLDVAIPVYGRVFPQTTPLPGTYSDTVTVTLTY